MEDNKQLSREDVNEIIRDFPIQPVFNKVVITLNKLENEDGVVTSNNSLSDVQYVISARPNSPVKAGDKIHLDEQKLLIQVPSETNKDEFVTRLNLDVFNVDGVSYSYIDDRAIKAIDKR